MAEISGNRICKAILVILQQGLKRIQPLPALGQRRHHLSPACRMSAFECRLQAFRSGDQAGWVEHWRLADGEVSKSALGMASGDFSVVGGKASG